MKKFQVIISLFAFIILLLGCEKDNTDPNNDENTIAFNGVTYNSSTGYIMGTDDASNSLTILIRGKYDSESQIDTTSGVSVIGGSSYFTIKFELVPTMGSSIEGTYSMGDLNGDGVTNEQDASDTGYCSSATLEMDETYSFYSGELTLKTTTIYATYYDTNGELISEGKTEGFNIQFSLKDTDNIEFTGNVNLTDNRN